MTTLRAAAQQALEALEAGVIFKLGWVPDCEDAITALRAALAEHYCDTHCTWANHAPGCALAEPVQEPVAWIRDDKKLALNDGGFFSSNWTPLYTSPPQRKPLTEEEIKAVIRAGEYDTMEEFARAIEQKHGIGSKT